MSLKKEKKKLADCNILIHRQQGHMNHKVHCSVCELAVSVRILLPSKSLILFSFLKLDVQSCRKSAPLHAHLQFI